jgi:Ser/Thr protein kinase RdoA (MazF antagonist)
MCELFALGDPNGLTVAALPGCANRLWRLDLAAGRFVVKEFRYTVTDARWVATIRRGAEFELSTWAAGVVPMAQPIQARDGQLLPLVTSSRGGPTLVRTHRWCDGERLDWPTDEATAAEAGRQLALIQRCGAQFQRQKGGALRWWRWRPLDVLERLGRASLLEYDRIHSAALLLDRTERLVEAGEHTDGAWMFSHFDHKPDNVVRFGKELRVLDWDEAAPCHPRLEAVESALRWAGIERGRPSDELFVAFINGYRDGGGHLSRLQPSDFAKCAAGLLGWFDYQGRRALREFDDDDAEAMAAAETARSTLASLDDMFDRIGEWCSLVR